MEPTLEAALKNIPGGDGVIEKFKLIFPSVTVPSVTVNNSHVSIVSSNNSEVRLKQPQKTREKQTNSVVDSIPIKVIDPFRKRESKTYMLNLHIETTNSLNHLREEILEQLGKDVISFGQ